jgi:hypothetical protein
MGDEEASRMSPEVSEKNLEECRLLGTTKELLLLCAKKELIVGGRTEYCVV